MTDINDIRYWVDPLLQGLAYWLGYSRVYYSNHLLKEGAIVGEAVKILYSKRKDENVYCEVMYKEYTDDPDALKEFGGQLADIVIADTSGNLKHIIEVKRGLSSKANITADLRKLLTAKKQFGSVGTFLLIVSEKAMPQKYVTPKGNARTAQFNIDDGYYRIRRVCKAGHSFAKKENAHYCCLIEVYN